MIIILSRAGTRRNQTFSLWPVRGRIIRRRNQTLSRTGAGENNTNSLARRYERNQTFSLGPVREIIVIIVSRAGTRRNQTLSLGPARERIIPSLYRTGTRRNQVPRTDDAVMVVRSSNINVKWIEKSNNSLHVITFFVFSGPASRYTVLLSVFHAAQYCVPYRQYSRSSSTGLPVYWQKINEHQLLFCFADSTVTGTYRLVHESYWYCTIPVYYLISAATLVSCTVITLWLPNLHGLSASPTGSV
jgi:hypothetical protein